MTHNTINYLEKFRQHGFRITRQRLTILDALCMADGHATNAEIYQRAKEIDELIDRSTIYRTLDVLFGLGLVICGEDINGERVYELVREQNHHHLICRRCGEELEIDTQAVDDFYQYLENEHNYFVQMDHLMVFGICSGCSA